MRAAAFRLAASLAAVAALGLFAAASPCRAERPPLQGAPVTARTEAGLAVGRTAEGVKAFRGLPYAAAPVGELRWRPPQPAPRWAGARDASRFGSDCLQHPLPAAIDPGSGQPTSEDCLFLNVWAPASGGRHPVMVWIHGGGFTIGSGAIAATDGAALARRGVVVVTLNYRLGRFGFFAHPALARAHPDEPQGDYAFLDQIAALKWVRRNIAAFGGDPGAVTVFGESAGGGSVIALMGSPLARGLFGRAIVESGGGRDVLPSLHEAAGGFAAGYAAGEAFAAHAGLTAPDAAALRALPASVVLGDLGFFNNRDRADYAGPMIDGRVVTGSPADLFAAGREAPVPLIIGFNSGELTGARAFMAASAKAAAAEFGPREAELRRLYDPDGGEAGFADDFLSDLLFVEPARFLAAAHAAHGRPTWLYQFSYVAEAKRATTPRAGHASEIPYVFGTIATIDPQAAAADRATAALTSGFWLAFAQRGRPAPAKAWPPYSAAADTLLDISAAGAAPLTGRSRARLDFLAAARAAR
jgi:para-nitrobenzyl esterase